MSTARHSAAYFDEAALVEWATQLLTTQEKNGCLHPPASALDFPDWLQTPIYVRSCYRKLSGQLLNRVQSAQRPLGFIVTGTPGIGKTVAALFLIQQLGLQRKLVCYEYPEESSWDYVRIKFDFRSGNVKVSSHLVKPAHRDGEYFETFVFHPNIFSGWNGQASARTGSSLPISRLLTGCTYHQLLLN